MYGFSGMKPPYGPGTDRRLFGWGFFTLLLFVALALIAPHQMPVVLYKVALVTLGAVLGYHIDRALFPYARPHEMHHTEPHIRPEAHWPRSLAMIRRAIIVLAVILGLTLGL